MIKSVSSFYDLSLMTDILRFNARAERSIHKVVNLFARCRRQVICRGIILELELGPDDKMNNLLVHAIRPVVVEDLDVIFALNEAASTMASLQVFFEPSYLGLRKAGLLESHRSTSTAPASQNSSRCHTPW